MPAALELIVLKVLWAATFALLCAPIMLYICRSTDDDTLSRTWLQRTWFICGSIVLCASVVVIFGTGGVSGVYLLAGALLAAFQLMCFVLSIAAFTRWMGRPPAQLRHTMEPQPVADVLMHGFVILVLSIGGVIAYAELTRQSGLQR